jgi:hypothetical protein
MLSGFFVAKRNWLLWAMNIRDPVHWNPGISFDGGYQRCTFDCILFDWTVSRRQSWSHQAFDTFCWWYGCGSRKLSDEVRQTTISGNGLCFPLQGGSSSRIGMDHAQT